jgi:hypothetical protein
MIVGGTGMLAGASRYVASEAVVTSMFARTEGSLSRFRQSLPPCCVHTLQVDYRSEPALGDAVRRCVENAGVPDVVLAWIHTTPPARMLAAQLAGYERPLSFFHVLGSASASPASSLSQQRLYDDAFPTLSYHPIVLGFKCERDGSRWLHHEEITEGVIEAVTSNLPCYVVGTVEPWDARP